MSTRAFAWLLLPVALGAASFVPWEDLAEGDAIYALATRFATVDGHLLCSGHTRWREGAVSRRLADGELPNITLHAELAMHHLVPVFN